MRRLLTAWGVDYDQWRALIRVALKLDFRKGMVGAGRIARRTRGIGVYVMQFIFYSMIGGFMAFAVAWIPDPFLSAIITLTLLLFMVATAVLIDHNSAITSPDDYGILAFHPVSSRTYFAARLANVFVYTLAMATVLGYLPAIAFFVRHGAAVGLAALFAMYGGAIGVTLTVMLAYAWMLRVVGPRRLRSALSWLQLVISMFVYGGYILVTRSVSKSVLETLTLPRTPWLFVYPATWFASWVELATGLTGPAVLGPAAASLLLLGALALGTRGRLSLEYAERLGALTSATHAQKRKPAKGNRLRQGRWFRGGEARAVALLVRSQFRNDMRFRMGVLSILPLTLIYLFMGLQQSARSGSRNLTLVSLAVLLFPVTLKMHLGRSETFRASWIFFSSPADRTRLVRSAKNVLVTFFVLPYLAFVAVLLLLFRYPPPYVAVYALFTGLVSHLVLQLATLVDPELPFSRPLAKGRGAGTTLFTIMIIGALGGLLPFLLERFYRSGLAIAIVFSAVIAASLAARRLTRFRVERRAARLEFEG
jgi:hypothetical protein